MAKQDSYQKAGVDYSKLDPSKVSAQHAAAETAPNLTGFGFSEVATSRGESAYVWDQGESFGAFVVEGLGTKNLVADEVRKYSGKSHYDALAQDTIAMIVNDLVVVGALPTVINAYWATGDSAWHDDAERVADLVSGWRSACDAVGATWGGGETPALKGVIESGAIDLGGAAIGIIQNKENLVLGDTLVAGDRILLVESSGVHANGITLTRKIAAESTDGYEAKLSDGSTFGETLLTPTHLYVDLIKKLQKSSVEIHYMVNITGHGWRKLMRGPKKLTYRMKMTPKLPPVFEYIKQASGSTDEDMYGNYNMGAGFALYVPAANVDEAMSVIQDAGYESWDAGVVEEGDQKVIIQPLEITFEGDSLGVRG